MRRTNHVLLALSFSLAACASAAKSSDTSASPSNASRISADEIAAANVATAYDAVYSLHRPWFRDMSAGASGDVFVYVDNRAVEEGKDALRQIPATQVLSIDYLKSADAVL